MYGTCARCFTTCVRVFLVSRDAADGSGICAKCVAVYPYVRSGR